MRLIFVFCIILSLFLTIKTFLWFKSYRAPQIFGVVINRINTNDKVVALTYDDGPNPPFTDQLLKVLSDNNTKATFFLLGENLVKNPEYIQKITSQGHDIGNHTWSHKQLIFKSPTFIKNEIEKTDSLIRSQGYLKDIHFRAPYGRKLFILPWILSSQGRKHILFDVAPDDWENPGIYIVIKRVISSVKPGSIILLHDGGGDRSQTVEATKSIIDILKKDGYSFLTISEMLSRYKY